MTTEDRVDRMEEIIVLLKTMIVRHQERLDSQEERVNTFDVDFKRSREDFEFKLNALIDAQLKNEEGIAELKASTTELSRSSTELRKSATELREASASQLHRIERLEQI